MIKSFFLNKKWAFWAWGGFLFIIGSLLAQTWIDVKINEWYKNFYDLLQKATERDVSEFYDGLLLFMKLAMMDASIDIAQVLSGNNPTGITVKKPEKNQSPPQDNFDSKPELPSDPEEKAETAPGPSASVSEPNPIEEKNISLEDITNSWAAIITELENQNSKIAHFLEEAILKEFDGKQLMIELINGHRFHLKTLEKDILVIESIMKNILQHSIKIKFQIQESTEIKSNQKKVENLEHPLFMKALETFEGEIIR